MARNTIEEEAADDIATRNRKKRHNVMGISGSRELMAVVCILPTSAY